MKRALKVAALVASLLPAMAAAKDFPTGTVTLIIPNTAGGPSDLVARAMAPKLQEKWGKPVIVENRPGATGAIATTFVARGPADGHTLLVTTNSMAILYTITKQPTFDPVKDFTPLAGIGTSGSSILVTRPDFPANNPTELLDYVKANPQKVRMGMGSTQTLVCTKAIVAEGGLDVIEAQYNGFSPTLTGLLSGEIDAALLVESTIAGQVEAGKVKLVAYTGKERDPDFSDVPTFVESGLDVTCQSWQGVFAPSGTPPEVTDKIRADIADVLSENPELFGSITGFDQEYTPPDELAETVKEDVGTYARIVEEAKIDKR